MPSENGPDPVASSVRKGILSACGTIVLSVVALCVVVLVFIAILPAFNQNRGPAQKAQNATKIHQVQTAILIYSSDFDNRFPIHSNWQEALSSYDKYVEKNVTWEYLDAKGLLGFNKNLSTVNDQEIDRDYNPKVILLFQSRFKEGKNVVGSNYLDLREGEKIQIGPLYGGVATWTNDWQWSLKTAN